VLTNSTEAAVQTQLESARLREFFSDILSVDSVRRFKPAPEAYAYASERLDIAPQDLLLVAAHDWDVAGAMHAGWRAAFVARHGSALNPLAAPPELAAPDIRALAERILASGIAA
jgi:2-haloacid dehalogenase